jgi:hypothetical protein
MIIPLVLTKEEIEKYNGSPYTIASKAPSNGIDRTLKQELCNGQVIKKMRWLRQLASF